MVSPLTCRAPILILVPGRANYRGERSEYYRAQYAEQIARLKLGVIPGLQNFEQTVGRRLGPLYELIHQTRLRLGRINDTIKEIDAKIQVTESINAQKEIKRGNDANLELQKKGAKIVWAILATYYISSFILHDMLPEEITKEHPFINPVVSLTALTYCLNRASDDKLKKFATTHYRRTAGLVTQEIQTDILAIKKGHIEPKIEFELGLILENIEKKKLRPTRSSILRKRRRIENKMD